MGERKSVHERERERDDISDLILIFIFSTRKAKTRF